MSLSKNTSRGFLGLIDITNYGVFSIDEIISKPSVRSFTYTENSGASNFNVTIPSDTQVGDLLIYFAGCRDGRSQNGFTSGWTDLAVGLQNIFLRYKTAQAGDIGSVVAGTWSGSTTGPAAVFAIGGWSSIFASVQERVAAGYSLLSPYDSTIGSLAILFNQDRALNTRSPGLSEDLRTAAIGTSSYYTFQLERTSPPPYPTQTIGNVSSDSVGAYVVITR